MRARARRHRRARAPPPTAAAEWWLAPVLTGRPPAVRTPPDGGDEGAAVAASLAGMFVLDDVDRAPDHLRAHLGRRIARGDGLGAEVRGAKRVAGESGGGDGGRRRGESTVLVEHLLASGGRVAGHCGRVCSSGRPTAGKALAKFDLLLPGASDPLTCAGEAAAMTTATKGRAAADGIVIAGGGLAGQRCAEALRRAGYDRRDQDRVRRSPSPVRPTAAVEGAARRHRAGRHAGVPAAAVV